MPIAPPPGWEIPTLSPDYQATEVVAPVTSWGTIGRTRPMPGTYIYYLDDFKFTALWKKPDLLIQSGCKVAIEVNYSSFDSSTPEEVLKGIYRKRVLSAYWGANGIRMIVDLNVASAYLDYALLGVPKGWRAYATRCHRLSQMDAVEREYDVAVAHAGTDDILFVVYGGSKKAAAYCDTRPSWVHISEHIEVIRGRALPYGGITINDLYPSPVGPKLRKPVQSLNPRTGEVKTYPTIESTAADGFWPQLVGRCCSGKAKTHKKLEWSYLPSDGGPRHVELPGRVGDPDLLAG